MEILFMTFFVFSSLCMFIITASVVLYLYTRHVSETREDLPIGESMIKHDMTVPFETATPDFSRPMKIRVLDDEGQTILEEVEDESHRTN